MSVMIVGADRLGNIEKKLRHHGIYTIEHVSGRNVSDRKKFCIPQPISLVIVLIDYINHGTARNIKEQAKAQGVPMIFAKRSWCSIARQLDRCGFQHIKEIG